MDKWLLIISGGLLAVVIVAAAVWNFIAEGNKRKELKP